MSALRTAARSNILAYTRTFSATVSKSFSTQQALKASGFDPKTYSPVARYGAENIRKILSKSILNEVAEEEAKSRIELAAAYRLFDIGGWNENIYNHLTAKVTEKDGSETFLINPFGLKYSEITASSLIKVKADGSIVNPGVTGDLFGINEPGFIIHSAIHENRPDIQSVMHCHYQAAAGVSSVKTGLMELTQTCHQVGPISYHDYNGIVIDMEEQKSLVEDLGPENNIMILRNHGVITCGESVGAAWYSMYQLLHASEIVTAAAACTMGDRDNLIVPAEKFVEKTFEVTRRKGITKEGNDSPYGTRELSAYMRWLDAKDMSYRT